MYAFCYTMGFGMGLWFMWLYFRIQGLVRTRGEWERYKAKRNNRSWGILAVAKQLKMKGIHYGKHS